MVLKTTCRQSQRTLGEDNGKNNFKLANNVFVRELILIADGCNGGEFAVSMRNWQCIDRTAKLSNRLNLWCVCDGPICFPVDYTVYWLKCQTLEKLSVTFALFMLPPFEEWGRALCFTPVRPSVLLSVLRNSSYATWQTFTKPTVLVVHKVLDLHLRIPAISYGPLLFFHIHYWIYGERFLSTQLLLRNIMPHCYFSL